MKTIITVVCDNYVSAILDVLGEHGLALFIERGNDCTLLDTGQGTSIAHNARLLGKRLASLNRLVLSHGHYDHTGGLPQVLSDRWGLEVIAHPGIFGERYANFNTPSGKRLVYVGMHYSRNYLESGLGAQFRLLIGCREIAPGMLISGEVPRRTGFEKGDSRLVVRENEHQMPDPVPDDVSLLVETSKGPVVLLGCAHAGAVNILSHFADKTGYRRFYAVIGGAHLNTVSEGQLKGTLEGLDEFEVEKVALNHCTGLASASFMAHHLGSRFAFAGVGWNITI
jgi:7,8-dihydropterin-6-yl-methyl-4-(beta-D-ribofuranosyl)aminobenzene 5'-phosphate synthase